MLEKRRNVHAEMIRRAFEHKLFDLIIYILIFAITGARVPTIFGRVIVAAGEPNNSRRSTINIYCC